MIRVVLGVVLSISAGCAPASAQRADTIDPLMKARVDAIVAGVMQQR